MNTVSFSYDVINSVYSQGFILVVFQAMAPDPRGFPWGLACGPPCHWNPVSQASGPQLHKRNLPDEGSRSPQAKVATRNVPSEGSQVTDPKPNMTTEVMSKIISSLHFHCG